MGFRNGIWFPSAVLLICLTSTPQSDAQTAAPIGSPSGAGFPDSPGVSLGAAKKLDQVKFGARGVAMTDRDDEMATTRADTGAITTVPGTHIMEFESTINSSNREGFHWGRALAESGMFLAMQHSFLAWRDYGWVTSENGIPFNHYWRDYKKSLHTWANSGWDDGDPFLDNYVGHPIQGALTGYFELQNDPKGAGLEFSNTKPYWISRLKAMAWNAAYSTQWEIGPLGEMTVEKYGTWGSWPQHGKMVNGEGQVDLVITPFGGFGWMLGEDLLDRYVVRRVESRTGNRFAIGFTRCVLNPIRGGANILHGKKPWYRRSRDARAMYAGGAPR